MKKLLFAALLTVTLAVSSFAKEANKISARTLRNFNYEFYGAQNVQWKITDKYAKATFELNGEMRDVFYNFNGEMIGSSTAISLNQLPVFAKRSFAKKYDGYTVKEAIRFDGADESAYYISAENEKEIVVLKVTNDSNISVFKKDRKK